MNYIKIEQINEAICVLTISSPKTLNALNRAILEELGTAVDSITSDTRVLIITGDGKSFVAGADISEMKDLSEQEGYEFSKFGSAVFKKIEDLSIPVIAAVNGFALGGGCELALSCDIRIASENALFGQPEVKLGILPGFSGTVRLSKIVGQGFAKELIFTGRVVKADEALRIGLVNSVVTLDVLMDTCIKMAGAIVANAPIAVAYSKQSINQNYDMNIDEAIDIESKYFAKCFASKDQKEGMTAFMEKRKPTFINQ